MNRGQTQYKMRGVMMRAQKRHIMRQFKQSQKEKQSQQVKAPRSASLAARHSSLPGSSSPTRSRPQVQSESGQSMAGPVILFGSVGIAVLAFLLLIFNQF